MVINHSQGAKLAWYAEGSMQQQGLPNLWLACKAQSLMPAVPRRLSLDRAYCMHGVSRERVQ